MNKHPRPDEDDIPSPLRDPIRKACNSCRSRKLGCNREDPCSNCVQAKVRCTYSLESEDARRAKRRRVLISTQYEQKIDSIEGRLNDVAQELRNLASLLHCQRKDDQSATQAVESEQRDAIVRSNTQPVLEPGRITGTLDSHLPSAQDHKPHFEGETSMTTHTNSIVGFIRSLRAETSPERAVRLDTALTDLSSLNHDNSKLRLPALTGCVNKRCLPNMELAMICLGFSKYHGGVEDAWLCGLISRATFTEILLRVMFNPNFSDAEYIIILAGLYWLFKDVAASAGDKSRPNQHLSQENLAEGLATCQAYLETALSLLPLQLPQTIEQVMALGFAANYAVEVSKPFSAWGFLAAAAKICVDIGLHRETSLSNEKYHTYHEKLALFWNLYVLDRRLSVCFGRIPNFADCDITMPEPSSANCLQIGIGPLMIYWIRIARVEGRIYEQLYSPTSKRCEISRNNNAQQLAHELLAILKDKQNEQSKISASEEVNLFWEFEDIHIWSLLTLIHKSSNPVEMATSTCGACISAARAAMEKHDSVMTALQPLHSSYSHMYIQWALLPTPFVPFVVIFCNIIETKETSDLNRLKRFVISLKSISDLSDGALRMLHLCQMLTNIALKYCEGRPNKTKQHADQSLDPHLETLGFRSYSVSVVQNSEQVSNDECSNINGLSTGYDPSTGTAYQHMSDSNNPGQPVLVQGEWYTMNHQMLELMHGLLDSQRDYNI